MQTRSESNRTAIACCVLALITFAVFGSLMSCGFIDFDDPDYVFHNEIVKQGLTLDGIKWAFHTNYVSYWHPLTWMSHMLDCQLFGVTPGNHHMVSLLIHVATTLLIFIVFKRMTGAFWRSAMLAALFALHPVHVESVAWIAERKDVLCAFFWVLTMWAYARYCELQRTDNAPAKLTENAWFFYGLALVFFCLGAMSKPMIVTLPCALLLLDFWPLRRISWLTASSKASAGKTTSLTRIIGEKVPFFVLTVIVCVVTYYAQQDVGAMQHTDALPFHRRLDNTIVSYARYIGKTIFPTDLAILYPYPDSWPRSTVIAAALLLVVITGFAIATFKKRPYFAFGWFWFIGTLVPVIGLVQVGMQAMADHYTYLPGIGLFVMLVWGIAEAPKNPAANRTAFAVTATAALAICVAISVTQLQYWKSSETVFEHAAKVTKKNAMVHFILAHVYQQENRMEDAGMHMREAMNIALEHFEAAVQEAPDSPDVQANLALALSRQGRFVEAAEHFAIAVKLQPTSPTTQFNWGISCAQSGNFNEAIAHLTEAVRLKPDYKEAQTQLEALKERAARN